MLKYPRPLLSLLAFAFLACNVFDESLIPSDSGDAGSDAERLAEDCVGRDIPTFDSLNDFRQIDTSKLKNDRFELSCVGNAQGNDGFFKVEMKKGKKWHFHVKVSEKSEADPAVYVLDSGCQDSVCQRGWGLNECVAGQDEHFSFFPPRDGTYFVGVDSMTSGGEPLLVLAVQPDCGNAVKEHSETCDDGNVDPGDGCDEVCRQELSKGSAKEVEPNDEPTANANVLVLDEGALKVTGQLGTKCDFDSYAVEVEEGGSVRALLTNTGGDTCDVDLKLQLVDTDGLTPLKTLRTSAGTCPVIEGTESFASNLPAGTYFVRVTTEREDEPAALDYALEIEAPAP
jgi:cysteine-rich repeat protein